MHNTNSRTHKATLTAHCHVPSRAVTAFPPPRSPQPEPSMAAHGVEYPVLFAQVGSARLAVSPPGFW